jgi:uncharacterized protein YndB with AHSA1/START domain
LERIVRIAARPEIIFSFFTDPSKLVRWFGSQCSLDPTPGGIFRTEINPHLIIRGQYMEVVPYSRLVFTWGWEAENSLVPPGTTTVEISLIPDGSSTIVRLRHHGLPPAEEPGTGVGWDHYLERLVTVAEGHTADHDSWIETRNSPRKIRTFSQE